MNLNARLTQIKKKKARMVVLEEMTGTKRETEASV
jgi:hypothetical protein